jgi:nucleoside-diphosphate-sugar epimerase
MNCAHAAAKFGVKRYVEVSSGQVTSNHKEPIKEDDQIMPITSVAKYKLEVEKQLKDVPNLPYTVVRPAIVYGLGDRTGLSMCFLCLRQRH